MHKPSQERLQTLVDPLRLSIRLWMVRRAEIQGCICHFEQILPQSASKNLVSIGHNGLWHPMQLVRIVDEHLGH